MLDVPKAPVGPGEISLTIGVMGPDEARLKAVSSALAEHHGLRVTEFSSYPPKLEDLPEKLAQTYDVIMIDVDTDPEYSFGIVDSLCNSGRNYVMAYSAQADMKLAVRFMRAGVREFFTLPLDAAELAGALKRAADHSAEPVVVEEDRAQGKLFIFLGTKGGCGVTTLASNFALALAQESDRETVLIDFGLPLGDVAINLGISSEYSVNAALQHPERLDANLLSTLAVKHSSGLSVLAGPNDFPPCNPTPEAITKLLKAARGNFEFTVVDVGSRVDLMDTALFEESATVFLITQVGITEMRTANRMISNYFARRFENLQIVLNRYKSNDLLFDDNKINEALTRQAQWKIPDDYAAARRKRDTAEPMVLTDSAIAHSIRQMAKSAGGLITPGSEKKGFFRFLR
jgi:pilus assembly protein CpaE